MNLPPYPYLAILLLSTATTAAFADRLVDPTRPMHAKVPMSDAPKRVRLEAILRSEDHLVAIVNGQIVRVGDRVGDARIDEIQHNSVRYTRAGRSEIARLTNQSIPVRQNVASHEDET